GMLALQQRKSLDSLSEAHVVGQASAQPVLPKKSEPGETAHLIWPQSTLKIRGRRKLLKACITAQFPEQFTDPAFAAGLFELDARRRPGSAQCHANHLAGRHRLTFPKVQRRANALGIERQ